jgi:hypothetical protein
MINADEERLFLAERPRLKIKAPQKRLGSGGGEFALANGQQFVVAQSLELRLEDVDDRNGVTESVEDFQVVAVLRAT